MRRILGGIRIVTVILLVALVTGWSLVLWASDTSEPYVKDFWTVMAGLAPALVIAYVVAISDALRTYTSLKDRHGQVGDRTDRERGNAQIRITLAFVGGSIGIAFAWLQAVALMLALRAVVTKKPPADPDSLIWLCGISVFVIPVVAFLAHAWWPWKWPASSQSRGA